MKEKQIQVPELLYNQMAAYCLIEDMRTPELLEQIKKGVYDKLDRKTNHEIYTRYKTAATEEQREKARKEYLNRIGLSEDFQW